MNWLIARDKGHSLEREFARNGPWVTKFIIDGKPYGGEISFENDIRISQFYDNFPEAHSILDLGSLEGGQTFQLAKHPDVYILGIEGRKANIERAKFVQRILGIKNVDFVMADLGTTDLTKFGQFNAVFCCGILYHLPEPWKLIEQIKSITNQLFIWTHYALVDKADQTINGFRGYYYKEHGTKDPLSGLSQRSFWPTLQSLYDILMQSNFKLLKSVENNPDHPHGPCITLIACQK